MRKKTILFIFLCLTGCVNRDDLYAAFDGGVLAPSVAIPADGRSSADITLQVSAGGEPVAGVMVVVGSDGNGTIVQPPLTDSTGRCHASISSTQTGPQTLSATVLLKGKQVPLPQRGVVAFSADVGSARTSTLTATPSQVAAGSATLLTATIKDVWGTPLAGQSVTFSSSGRSNSLSPGSGTTDANGRVSISLRSTAAEMKSLSAAFSSAVINASMTFVAGPASSTSSTLVASPNALVADGVTTTQLQFTARDAYQNLIEGCQVAFSSHGLGGILAAHGVETNTLGQAGTLYHGTRAGLLNVIGSCQAASLGTAVNFTAPPVCTTGTPIYSSPPQILAGNGVMAITHGDFDEDGKLDIAVANAADNTVGLAISRGNGLFYPATAFPTGNHPSALVSVDVNRDSHVDCVLLNSDDDTLEVFLGNGRGNLQAGQAINVGTNPSALASADLNADGDIDFVVTNANDSTMSVLLGHGDGTFTSAGVYATSGTPLDVVLADINVDSHIDALAVGSNSNNLDIFLGIGAGNFRANSPFAGHGPHRSLDVADIDLDGHLDVVASAYNDTWIDVLIGTGTGSFSSPLPPLSLSSTPTAIALEDITRDGMPDIVASAFQILYTLIGHGDGTFGGMARFPAGSNPIAIDLYDIDGDDNQDVLSADAVSNHVSVNLGYGTGALETVTQFDLGGIGNNGSALADFNHDGNVDAATAVYYGDVLAISLGNGDGSFKQNGFVNVSGSPIDVFVADFNGDGNQDVGATWLTSGGGIGIALGNGDGTMQPVINANNLSSCSPSYPLVGDVNGDGKIDLAVLCGYDLYILTGSGDGTLGSPTSAAVASNLRVFLLADLNHDGRLDIAAVNGAATYFTLVGNGDGSFQAPVTTSLPSASQTISASDMNNDGNTDLVVLLANAMVAIILGHGDGTFDSPAVYSTNTSSLFDKALGDVNGDGHVDVLIYNDGFVAVMSGSQTGALSAPLFYPGPTRITFAASVELNHDGRMDILTSCASHLGESYDSLSPYLMTGCIQ